MFPRFLRKQASQGFRWPGGRRIFFIRRIRQRTSFCNDSENEEKQQERGQLVNLLCVIENQKFESHQSLNVNFILIKTTNKLQR